MSHSAAETVLLIRQAWERQWTRPQPEDRQPLVVFGAERSPFDLIQAAARGGTRGAVVGIDRAEAGVPVTTWTPEHQDQALPIVKRDNRGRGVLAILVDRPDQVGQEPPTWWTAVLDLGGTEAIETTVVVAVGPAVDQDPCWAQAGRVVIVQSGNRTIHPAWMTPFDKTNKSTAATERGPGLF